MARSKYADEEKITDANIERIIIGFEQEKPITKKAACNILNISYNTARLDKLINSYKERKEHDAKMRTERRGKPATLDEVSFIVTEYLSGATIDSISKGIYRGPTFINSVLEEYHVPKRLSSPDYFKPNLIPDGAVRETFKTGESVYSSRYDCLATIKGESTSPNGNVYRVWLDGSSQQQFAYQPWWELASLQHLRDVGIKI